MEASSSFKIDRLLIRIMLRAHFGVAVGVVVWNSVFKVVSWPAYASGD
jgi:hypothetical protein